MPTTRTPDDQLAFGTADRHRSAHRRRGRGWSVATRSLVAIVVLVPATQATGALAPPVYSTPVLNEVGRMVTSPIPGTSTSVGDLEGMAYVPGDDTIWLTDDKYNRVHELDRTSGELRSTITHDQFAATPILGGTQAAGPDRSLDLEAAAYDEPEDVLYLFSGRCCKDHVLPTVYRLTRDSAGQFVPESWQPLTSPLDDFSGATTDAGGQVWVALGKVISPYDFEANTVGEGFTVPNQRGNIRGLGSSPDGADLWIVSGASLLYRVGWGTKQIVAGHEFDLVPHDVRDGRAVEVIGDQIYVPDGYDSWPAGSSDAYAVRIFEVTEGSESGVAPVGGFTMSTTAGPAPLAVEFTDTSTDEPTSWAWDFGDGATSSEQHPSHTFADPGTYTVTLTATNAYGTSQPATAQVEVTVDPATDPATTVSLATDDAYVVSSKLNGNNGTNTFMRLGGGATQYFPYIGFTVDDLTGPVTNAVLRVRVTVGSDDGGIWRQVSNEWTETTITYGNAPARTEPSIAELGRIDASTWIEIDVTHLITGNGRYSFAASSSSSNNARFATKEAGTPAQLLITTAS